MMSNVFSTFDPATSMGTSMNWTSSIIVLFAIPGLYWLTPSRYNVMTKILYSKIHSEIKVMMGNENWGVSLLIVSLFAFIMLNNILGLLPFTFTSSAHMSFTLSMALPAWMGIMLFGWINNTQHALAHMVPESTPALLMPFMVCIETTSILIRPITLSVRLMANMIAGHLFMCMLGDYMLSLTTMMFSSMMIIEMLLILYETAVAVIQAYVFFTLTTLYAKEVTYENT